MSRKFLLWAMALVIIVPTIGGVAYWLYWNQFQRYAPVTIASAEDLPKIQKLLDQVDYVSPVSASAQTIATAAAPPVKAPALYMITYRDCAPCKAYEDKEIPRLQQAGIDTRIVVFAQPDDQGVIRSTPAERSTIAELWLNRKWDLYKSWRTTSDAGWTAEGLPVADNDMARTAVVGASRSFVAQMTDMLSHNKVVVGYPLLLWRDKNNQLRACACVNERGYHFIREELSVPSDLQTDTDNILSIPAKLLGSDDSASAAPPPTAKPGVKMSAGVAPAATPPAAKSTGKADYGPGAGSEH